ncbi:MAG: hypothetical protein AAB289_08900, partial [Chloroflexota bacterium]
MFRLLGVMAAVVVAGLGLAEVALADNCSGPADCEQTAGYNTGLAVTGGILAIGAGLFGSQIAASIAAMFPGLGGPAVGGEPAPLDGPGLGPTATGVAIVDPWTGEALPVWEPGKYGADDKGNLGGPGQVWLGEWMDPERARDIIRQGIEADIRRAQESQAFWEEGQRLSDKWLHDRTEQLQREAAGEAAVRRAREDAGTTLTNIETTAGGHGYDDILARAGQDAFNPDGTLNVDYVNRLRDALRARLGRDIAAPDETLNQGWVSDFAGQTFDDARHNPLIRVGAGLLSGGSSEIYFQSQAAWEAMQDAYNQAA